MLVRASVALPAWEERRLHWRLNRSIRVLGLGLARSPCYQPGVGMSTTTEILQHFKCGGAGNLLSELWLMDALFQVVDGAI